MTLEQLENIPDDEWGRASSRLLQFFKTRYDENECFPEGNSIEDLVNGAIADLIAGKRQYYVDQDLFWQLHEIIRSNFCKLFRSADCKKRNIIIASDDEKTENFDVVDFCELPVIIDDESFLQQLEKEIDGDDELGLMFISIIEDGAITPKEIADDTGLPVMRVYELKRKLGDRVRKVQRKMLKGVKGQVGK